MRFFADGKIDGRASGEAASVNAYFVAGSGTWPLTEFKLVFFRVPTDVDGFLALADPFAHFDADGFSRRNSKGGRSSFEPPVFLLHLNVGENALN